MTQTNNEQTNQIELTQAQEEQLQTVLNTFMQENGIKQPSDSEITFMTEHFYIDVVEAVNEYLTHLKSLKGGAQNDE
jgi:hypothetical protein